jgi:hypothetical protein
MATSFIFLLTREWSDPTCQNLPWFFSLQEYTTKSTVKMLAAKTHYKYFLKIAEVTHFFCTRNRLYQRFAHNSSDETARAWPWVIRTTDRASLLENLICYNGHNAHTYIVCNTSSTSSTFYPQWSSSFFILYSRHKNAKCLCRDENT